MPDDLSGWVPQGATIVPPPPTSAQNPASAAADLSEWKPSVAKSITAAPPSPPSIGVGTEPTAARDISSGLVTGAAQTLGAPVDIASGAINAISGAGRELASDVAHPFDTIEGLFPGIGEEAAKRQLARSKEIASTPLIGGAPPGGSEWFNEQLGAAGFPTTETVQPQTTGGKLLQQAVRGATMFAGPGLAGKGLAMAGAPAAGEAVSAMAPGTLGSNLAMGAAAGATGEVAHEAVPEWGGSRAAGELAGGLGAGLGEAAIGETGNLARRVMPLVSPAARQAAASQAAAETFMRAATPTPELQNLEDFANKARAAAGIPGSVPTTAEALNNPGLLALQRARSRLSPDESQLGNEMRERMAANNTARINALEGMAPVAAAPTDTQTFLRQQLAGIDAMHEPQIAAALQRAEATRGAAQPVMSPEEQGQAARSAVEAQRAPEGAALMNQAMRAQQATEAATSRIGAPEAATVPTETGFAGYGAAMRDPVQAAYLAERGRLQQMREAIDPTGTMGMRPDAIKQAVGEVRRDFHPDTFGGMESKLYQRAVDWGPLVPIDDAFRLRADINARLKNVSDHNPQEALRLQRVKAGIDQAIADAGADTERLEQAGIANPGMPPLLQRLASIPPAEVPFPEPANDIAAQIAQLQNPDSARDSVYVPKGTAMPANIPQGISSIARPEGTLLTTNAGKAALFGQAPQLDDATLARILGFPETRGQTLASGAPRVVQAKDAEGNVISEMAASPAGEPAARAVAVAQAPGATVSTAPVEDTIARRQQISAQSTMPFHSLRGTTDSAFVPSTGAEFPIEYGITDARALITSHNDDLSPNPAFPQALQPRSRERAETEAQISSILNGDPHDPNAAFRPELLDHNPDAANGAPIVGPEGYVESGNARTMAIRRAYDRGLPQAQAYRDYLAARGYPVGGVEQPVLVRLNRAQMDMPQREQLARDLNVAPQAAMSATDRAMADAQQIPPELLRLYQGGDMFSAANRPFWRAMMERIVKPSELPAMTNPEGGLSAAGQLRLRNAVLAKAYGDPEIISTLTEDPDSNIKAIGGALTDASPAWSQLRNAVAEGRVSKEFDLTSPLLDAVRLINHARDTGRNIAEFMQQRGLFGDAVSPETEGVLSWMLGAPSWTRRYSRDKMATAINEYAAMAQRPEGIIPADMMQPRELIEHARERAQGATKDLFASGLGEPGGPAPVRPGPGIGGEENRGPQPLAIGPAAPTGGREVPPATSTISDFRRTQAVLDPHLAARDYLLRKGQETGFEHFAAVAGRRVIDAGTSNDPKFVRVTPSTGYLISRPGAEIDIHHNHLIGNGLSAPDIGGLANPGIRFVVAHLPDGGVSAAQLTPQARAWLHDVPADDAADALATMNSRAGEPIDHALSQMVDRGQIGGKEADRLYFDMRARALDAAGVVHYMGTQPLPEWAQRPIKQGAAAIAEDLPWSLPQRHIDVRFDRTAGQVLGHDDAMARISAEAPRAATGRPGSPSGGGGGQGRFAEEVQRAGERPATGEQPELTPLTPEARERFAQWNREYGEMARAYRSETPGRLHAVGKILQKGGAYDSFRLADTEVPWLFVNGGKTSAEAMQRFLAVAPPEAQAALDDAFSFSLRKAAMRPDGTLDVKAYQKWLEPRQAALAERPELLDRFNTAHAAQQELDRTTEALREHAESHPLNPGWGETGILRQFWKPGPQGGETMRHYLDMTGNRPEAVQAAEDYAALNFASRPNVIKNGAVNPSAAEAWIKQHDAALSALPGLRERFADAATAQQAVDEAISRHLDARKEFTESVAGAFLQDDPERAVARLFQGADRDQKAQTLMDLVSKNDAAREGVQRAAIDEIVRKFGGAAMPGSEEPILRAQRMQDFINENRAVLGTLFPGDHAKVFDALAEDLRRSQLATNAKMPGGSDTRELFAHAPGQAQHGGMSGALMALLGEHVGSAVLGWFGAPIGAIAGVAAKHIGEQGASALQRATAHALDQMLLDPEFATEMLRAQAARPTVQRQIGRRLGQRVMQSAVNMARGEDLAESTK